MMAPRWKEEKGRREDNDRGEGGVGRGGVLGSSPSVHLLLWSCSVID